MMRITSLVALGAAFLAAACVPQAGPGSRGAITTRMSLDKVPDWSPAEARAHLADQTRITASAGHGMQVVYTSRDGRSYLWYPGNAMILAGRWRVEERNVTIGSPEGSRTVSQPRVCFQYAAATYNPVTGHQGGGWECTSYANLLFTGGRSRKGDVFGLSRRRAVPFVTTKQDRFSFEELAQKLGRAQ